MNSKKIVSILTSVATVAMTMAGAFMPIAAQAAVTLTPVTQITGINFAFDIQIKGNYALVASLTTNSIKVVDISNPQTPSIVDTIPLGGQPQHMFLNGNTLYVPEGSQSKLQIVDVTNPLAASVLGTISGANFLSARNSAIHGNYLYVATSTGVAVVDVSAPSAPTLQGVITLPIIGTVDVAVSGNYLYANFVDANAPQYGLKIYDISTNPVPTSPLSTTPTTQSPAALVVSGNYAYVAGPAAGLNPGGLSVINVSNPNAPVSVGFLQNSCQFCGAEDMVLSGNYLYAAMNSFGAEVFDISNPASPTLAASAPLTPAFAAGVAISGQYLFASNHVGNYVQVFSLAFPTPNLSANILSCWKLDETSGTRADSIDSAPLADTGGAGSAAGKFNNAASFSGAQNSSLTRSKTFSSTQSFTFAFWGNFNLASVPDGTFTRWFPTGAGGFGVNWVEEGVVTMNVQTSSFQESNADVQGTLDPGWRFIVGGWDASLGKPFLSVDNGPLSYGDPIGAWGGVSATQTFGQDASMLIDEVGEWTRALNAAEISQLYNGGIGLACPFGVPTPTPTPGPAKDILTFSLQTVGNGPATFDPIGPGAVLKVFNIADSAFTAAYGSTFASWKTKLDLIWTGSTGLVSSCTTDGDGACTANKAAPGNYLTVGRYVDNADNNTVYVSKNELTSDFNVDMEAFADLKIIKKFKDGALESYGPGGQVKVVPGVPLASSGSGNTIALAFLALAAGFGIGIYLKQKGKAA